MEGAGKAVPIPVCAVEFHEVLGGGEPQVSGGIFRGGVNRLVEIGLSGGVLPKGWREVGDPLGTGHPEGSGGLGKDLADGTGENLGLGRQSLLSILQAEQLRFFEDPDGSGWAAPPTGGTGLGDIDALQSRGRPADHTSALAARRGGLSKQFSGPPGQWKAETTQAQRSAPHFLPSV